MRANGLCAYPDCEGTGCPAMSVKVIATVVSRAAQAALDPFDAKLWKFESDGHGLDRPRVDHAASSQDPGPGEASF
jgi:hypothetical protein